MTTATMTREIVQRYHQAWTGDGVSSVGQYLSEDFITRAPVGSYDTKAGYLAGLANFRNQFVTGVDLISELYGDDEAILLYDVHTNTPARTIRTAEHFKLTDGMISFTNLVFDATAWRAMMATQGKTVDREGHVIDL